MKKLIPTGKARVYRTDGPGYLEMPLEQAREYVRRTPGTELFGIMREDDRG